jgi:hypothetical protein
MQPSGSGLSKDPIMSRKAAEIGFAIVLFGFGAAIVYGTRELDTGWSRSGPEAGYFPLRIGMMIMAAAAIVTLVQAVRSEAGQALLSRRSAVNIALFALPLLSLIAVIPFLGLYLPAALYLLVAIGLVGRVGWPTAAAVAVAAPLTLFVLFEFVFRTPLPKGPLGPLLGMI